MKFWDASVIIPRCLTEPWSAFLMQILAEDSLMIVWWGSMVECWSAFARLRREGLFFRFGQIIEEFPRVTRPVAHRGRGRDADHLFEPLPDAIHGSREPQAAASAGSAGAASSAVLRRPSCGR